MRILVVTAAAALLGFTIAAQAQTEMNQGGMNQGGMNHGMSNHDTMHHSMKSKTSHKHMMMMQKNDHMNDNKM